MQKTLTATNKGEVFHKWTDVSITLMARDWKGLQTYPFNAVLVIKKKVKNERDKPLD